MPPKKSASESPAAVHYEVPAVAPAAPVPARRGLPGLAIAGIVVGGVIAAGALFGGGVAVGAHLPGEHHGQFAMGQIGDRDDRHPGFGNGGQLPPRPGQEPEGGMPGQTQNGPLQNGPLQNGAPQNGTPQNGQTQNGQTQNGTTTP